MIYIVVSLTVAVLCLGWLLFCHGKLIGDLLAVTQGLKNRADDDRRRVNQLRERLDDVTGDSGVRRRRKNAHLHLERTDA